jgi:DNA (cytosine-5)-methyltransferase 1
MKTIKVGSDFSGVGAFNQALMRLGINYEEEFACDMDKYARDTFIHNYGEPKYYPTNVYEREIPSESLDIYMTSPPCQAFSLAGKRLGKEDKRGILFFNSHEFIQVNKPRFFIFENVKGLLSDDGGRTFQEWVNMLGGKSVNGVPVLFSYEESVPYHLYWQVLNAKHHGVPQNRERVFLIGIRDDADNKFQFPREEHLPKRLKDVLEDNVDDKYFLSEKMIDYISSTGTKTFYYKPEFLSNESEFAKPITTKQIHRAGTTNYLKIKSATSKGYEEAKIIKVGNLNPSGIGMNGCVYDEEGISPTLWSGHGEGVKIQYNIKRLNQTLEKHKLPKGEVRFVDSYNQSIHENSACINARINATNDRHLWDGYKIRRLTPRECFRLMDFPDTFTWKVSDSQAYKQAGNSIVVNVLYKILKQLPL